MPNSTSRAVKVTSTALIAAWFVGAHARADEIRVLSAASFQEVLKEVRGEFERMSGHKLVIRYGTMGAITDRLARAEDADIVISSLPSISALVKQGRIAADSQKTFAKVGIGIVAPSGTNIAPVASVEDLKQALLVAKVIIYADPPRGGAAGIHVAHVLDKLGMAEQLRPKIKLGAGGDVTEVTLAQGEGALGMTQISEIVGKPGATYLGPFPAELQNYTFFTLGTPIEAKPSDAASAFIAFMSSPTAIAAIKAKGIELN
jgi:molybdate transport system substrate-binding protein